MELFHFGTKDGKIDISQGFSVSMLLTFGLDKSLLWRAALYTVECLAADLAFTPTDASNIFTPSCDN